MTLFYGITFAVSLLMLIIYHIVDKKRNTWLFMLFIFVSICNAGYLALSLSGSLTTALWSNALAYLGNVYLPFCILMMVMQLTYLRYPKWLPNALIILNAAMLLVATSGGYLPIYYKEVSFEVIDGAAQLVKVYGPLHGFYKFFVLSYFAAIVVIIGYTAAKKTAVSTKHSIFLAFVLIGNIALWIVENITGATFEFLTISYLMTEGLLLLLYGIVQDYETASQAILPSELAYTDADLADNTQAAAISITEVQDVLSEAQIKDIFSRWAAVGTLTQRETEVLRFILENKKRKDIAQVLFVTESTIKKHTTNIYKKLGVANRVELFEQINVHLVK